MMSTTVWPRSWNCRSLRSGTAWPRCRSGAVGSTPSLMVSARPVASLVFSASTGTMSAAPLAMVFSCPAASDTWTLTLPPPPVARYRIGTPAKWSGPSIAGHTSTTAGARTPTCGTVWRWGPTPHPEHPRRVPRDSGRIRQQQEQLTPATAAAQAHERRRFAACGAAARRHRVVRGRFRAHGQQRARSQLTLRQERDRDPRRRRRTARKRFGTRISRGVATQAEEARSLARLLARHCSSCYCCWRWPVGSRDASSTSGSLTTCPTSRQAQSRWPRRASSTTATERSSPNCMRNRTAPTSPSRTYRWLSDRPSSPPRTRASTNTRAWIPSASHALCG